MARDTIDFGIDLGTTNSVISVAENGAIEVIKNGQNEITASVVYIDKKGRTSVGHGASTNLTRMSTMLDVQSEFKREMGTSAVRSFAAAGVEHSVVSLSAMVLRELRKAAEERFGDAPLAAVITVPAMFELPQRDATARAAREAGFEHFILLGEPIAAATAYGFSTDSDKVYWLVYDFGGGTFDASIISIRDDQLSVVKHAGDNYLGGADLDRVIVDTFIVPAIRSEFDLDDLHRDNVERMPVVKGRYAMLKVMAEEIKKELSRESSSLFYREGEFTFKDNSGDSVDVEVEVSRAQFEEAVSAYVDKSIEITRELIQDCGLNPTDIEKVLLVGGTTFVPLVQQKVESLGIPVDRSMDPMTVVSYGAAVFASSQRMPKEIRMAVPVAVGAARIELDYVPVSKELNPPVGGKVTIDNAPPPAGVTVVIKRDDDGFKTPDLPLNSKGIFFTEILLRDSGQSTFRIEVRDQSGAKLDVSPESFSITYGIEPAKPPLPSGLQIGLADGSTKMLIPAGTSLPVTTEHHTVHTVHDLKKGSQETLQVPILDGDEPVLELNRIGTKFQLKGSEISRDLPAGSEVQVTAEVDVSSTAMISFTIPLLDETYEVKQGSMLEFEPPGIMRDRLQSLRDRVDDLIEKGESSGETEAVAKVKAFASSPTFGEVERLIGLGDSGDQVAAAQARTALKDATKKLRALAGLVEWPAKLVEFENVKDDTKRSVHEYGDASDKASLDSVLSEAEGAIKAKDSRMLDRAQSQLGILHVNMLKRDIRWLGGMLQHLATRQSDFRDQAGASQLLNEGAMAMRREDVSSLQNIVQQLFGMLPANVAAEVQSGVGSGVI